MSFVVFLSIGTAAGVGAGTCTVENSTDFYIPNQAPSGSTDSAALCCALCGAGGAPSPVLPPGPHWKPYYTWQKGSPGQCYCKASTGERRHGSGVTSGSCGPAPPTPPPSPALPNYQGCATAAARALPYCDMARPLDERVAWLVANLTLHEKVSRMYSCVDTCDTCACPVPRLGLPAFAYLLEANTAVAAVCLGPERCATVYPGPLGLGAAFNRSMWALKGSVLGREVRAFNNNQGTRGLGPMTGLAAFGPNINIVRDPRFGRNSELPSEDPFLNGHYSVAMSGGFTERDAAGHPLALLYLKHFTAYSRETNRGHDTYAISPFDFGESYLPQYELGMRAVATGENQKSGGFAADGVMCSYNGENGAPSCANGWLLNDVLRKRWQRPDAVVVTDSGAVLNLQGPPVNASSVAAAAAMALNNGSDVNDGHGFPALADAIAQNLTTEAAVDTALTRSLTQLFRVGLFDQPSAAGTDWTQTIGIDAINSTAHQRAVHDAALQAMVLLRNEAPAGAAAPLLPLAPGAAKIAVVGPQAEARTGLMSDYATEQACADGSDSCVVSITDGIRAANGGDGAAVTSAQGVEVNSKKRDGIAAALAVAKAADVVVLALGIDKSVEGEGTDRPDITLPGLQSEFAERVLALRKPTLLILTNGGTLAIDSLVPPTRDAKAAPGPAAIVEAFNPCTNGATALGQLLFGQANRWGKLPVTIYPASYAAEQDDADFDMSAPPGRTYKYYGRGASKPLWPFGFGLSLTTFEHSCALAAPGSSGSSGSNDHTVECTVRNTGALDGDEVVLVYHAAGDDIRRSIGGAHPVPAKALVGFERVRVAAGSAERLRFVLSEDPALALVNATGDRHLYAGTHQLIFSRGHGADIALNVTIS